MYCSTLTISTMPPTKGLTKRSAESGESSSGGGGGGPPKKLARATPSPGSSPSTRLPEEILFQFGIKMTTERSPDVP